MTEMWDIVNRDGEPLGLTWERENHKNIPDGMYHPCVEVWVRVGDKLLITQRHPDKSDPLCYDVPGGAVLSGESTLLGAVRELSEEAGISASADSLVLLGRLPQGNVYSVSYMLTLESLPKIVLQPSEVVGYKLVTRTELEDMMGELTRGTRRRYEEYREKIFPAAW